MRSDGRGSGNKLSRGQLQRSRPKKTSRPGQETEITIKRTGNILEGCLTYEKAVGTREREEATIHFLKVSLGEYNTLCRRIRLIRGEKRN